jgi:hypothetical protein
MGKRPGPGTISARKGKWRIYTCRRGFRPRWETFDAAWVTQQMRRDCPIVLEDARGALRDEWARGVESTQYARVRLEMRSVSEHPTNEWQRLVQTWAGWVNALEMGTRVRFTKAKAA